MRTLITTLAVILLMCRVSSAAVYYVDNLGNDTNSGLSENFPWKTISKVNSTTFQSGDKILFKRGGVWYETLTINQNNLTFSSYGTGNLPLIDGQLTRTYNIFIKGRSGVTIQEFNTRNSAGSGSIRIESSTDCVVQNCEVYVTAHGGVFIQNSRNCIIRGISITTPDYTSAQTDGIYSQRNNGNIYENNYMIITNSHDSPHVDGIQCYLDTSITARGNYIEQRNPRTGGAQGIYTTNTYGRYYIYNNIINTPNTMSNSIALKNLDASLYKGTAEVYHNTVITRGGNALCIQNAPDFIARNNIFISRGTTYAVTVIGSFNGGNLDYNIYYNYGTDPSAVRLENNGGNHSIPMLQAKGLELNGMFNNPSLGSEYMPADNSPVIDKGTYVSICQVDKNGTVRPQGTANDLGALEKITNVIITPKIPAAPTGLTANSNSVSTITLNWRDVSDNENGFYIERYETSWMSIATMPANATTFNDMELKAGISYNYRIRAFNNDGTSAYSNTASATTQSASPVVSSITIEARTGLLGGGSTLITKGGSVSPYVVKFTAKSTAEYIINIPVEADWYIEGRFFHSRKSNSFTVQLNQGSKQNFSNSRITGQWSVGPKVFLGRLLPGKYTVTVTNIKPGDEALLDVMTLSTNPEGSNSVQYIVSDEEPVLRNYPNPFNPSTKIKFNVPAAGRVELAIYNSIGEKVSEILNEVKEAGAFEVIWNGSQFASGIYYCKMTGTGFTTTRKMILIK